MFYNHFLGKKFVEAKVTDIAASKDNTYGVSSCINMNFNGKTYMKLKAPTLLLLPLGKWGLKWGDFHWAMGCA